MVKIIPTLKPRIPTPDTRRVKPHSFAAPKFADRELGTAAHKAWRAAVVERASGLCQGPEHQGDRSGHRLIADHIHERRDGGALYDLANGQALCPACHGRKTHQAKLERGSARGLTHPGWLRPVTVPLVIVCGPPGAGKSTWVRTRADRRDLVLDLDEIAAEVSGLPLYHGGHEWLDPALRVRNRRLGLLGDEKRRWPAAWLIVGEPSAERRQWWHNALRPRQVVVLATPLATCLARINADARRPDEVKHRHCTAAMRWWDLYDGPSTAVASCCGAPYPSPMGWGGG